MDKRQQNMNLIRTWAEDSSGYERSVLFSFWHACNNPHIMSASNDPTPKGARKWAKQEDSVPSGHSMYVDCQAAADTFKRLSDKLHELDS